MWHSGSYEPMVAHCVSTVTGDSLLGADAATETLELARRFNMLELDGGVNYAGKVNFSSAGDAFDFDAAEPTANSWQFTIKDISDTGLATARVLIYLHDEAGTVGPDNVSTVLPANWKVRERYFNSLNEAIEYLTTVEADREAFNRQNSEACRNALAVYARRSN